MIVVPVADTIAELERGSYVCPNTLAYTIKRRCRFLGAYYSKAVRSVAEVVALVQCGPDFSEPRIAWSNSDDSSETLINRAKSMTPHLLSTHPEDLQQHGLQFCLMRKQFITYLAKDSPGGIQGKRYSEGITIKAGASEPSRLAERLNNRGWSEFQ